MRSWSMLFLVLLLTACGGSSGGGADQGGGSGGSGGGGSGGGGSGGQSNPGPAIALLFCSGHDFSGAAPTYLAGSAAPQLEGAVSSAGHSFQSFHFADDIGGGAVPGYLDLVARLQAIRDQWVSGRSDPTRVLVVAHSHGCVRAHAAMRAVPDCPVRLLADLDGSSNGWALVHPPSEAATMGGGPINAYDVGVVVGCPDFPTLANEGGTVHDLEDVVWVSVEEAFEVRSGALVPNPLQLEQYDERWNARVDGTTTGLTCYYSATSHSEVHLPGGTTLGIVQAWILDRLASDAP